MGFQTDRIVCRIHITVLNQCTVTVDNIHPVVIPVSTAMHRDTVDQQVLALVIGLRPESRIHHRHPFYFHVLAFAEIDQFRTVGNTSQLQLILDHP